MEIFKGKIVGIGRGVGKTSGNPFTMVHISGKPFSEKQISSGCVGNQVNTYFADSNITAKLNNDMVGKDVTCTTVFAGGKDLLCDITV